MIEYLIFWIVLAVCVGIPSAFIINVKDLGDELSEWWAPSIFIIYGACLPLIVLAKVIELIKKVLYKKVEG